jgi:precorrin-4 methylase
VEKIRLANQEQYGKAGIELQVRLADIECKKAVGIAAVQALGNAIASADMKIIGDATMMQSIMASFYRGQNAGALAEGFLEAAPKEVKEIAFETVERISGVVSDLAKGMFGKDVPADLIASAVKAELAKQGINGVATS